MPGEEPDGPCQHFPVSNAPQDARNWLDAGSDYRFVLTGDEMLTADELQTALRFAEYQKQNVPFALIAPNIMVLPDPEWVGHDRGSFEAAVRRVMVRTVREKPDAETMSQPDGWGVVLLDRRVAAMVPPDQMDRKQNEVPPDILSAWCGKVLDACGRGLICLLAVPAGQEHLLDEPCFFE